MKITGLAAHERLLRFIVVALLMFGVMSLAGAQKAEKCKAKLNTDAPEYRIGQTMRTVSGPPALVILISVDAKYFNRENMSALARRLNEEFCNEQRLTAMLFDDYRSAKSFVFHPHAKNFDRNLASWRGNYKLDREKGIEEIKFATEQGNSRDEVEVVLSKKP